MKHKKCLICNHERLKPLKKYSKNHLVKCESCGFVFCHQIPSIEELENYYNAHYGRQDYDSPITRKRYNELLDKLEIYRKTNNLIDVGSGVGFFLEEAKKRGWNVYGTEFTEDAVQICQNKGIKMKLGALNPDNYLPESFDIVTSFEVIEHINTPQDEISNINKLLRTGGCFYTTTPNFNSLSRMFLKESWVEICYPEHLCYYTAKTYKSALKNLDFKTRKIRTTGISLTRFKKVVFKSSQKLISASSDDEKIRVASETKIIMKFAKSFINYTLNLFHIGDSLKVFAEKS